jgi:hypothetical protein
VRRLEHFITELAQNRTEGGARFFVFEHENGFGAAEDLFLTGFRYEGG